MWVVLEKIPAGKNATEFHGNWDLLPFPCKYRARGPIQTFPEEILISRSHHNGYRENPDFPFPSKRFSWKCLFSRRFRSRAVTSRGNIDFPNPVHTKTAHKQNRELFTRVLRARIAKREQHARCHVFVDDVDCIGPVSGLRCTMYFVPVFLYFSFCV